jgi:hypothetical protein
MNNIDDKLSFRQALVEEEAESLKLSPGDLKILFVPICRWQLKKSSGI